MEVISKNEFMNRKEFFINEMKRGKIFIYPTDTIYGIGCDAENLESVGRIREIKNREEKPFSVIAPNKKWIRENCVMNDKMEEWMSKLPGKYTFILNLKNGETLGVRIPNNWFYEIVNEFGIPFITTSVNLTGEKPINELGDLDETIKKRVDYFVDDGILNGKPSKVVDLTDNKENILRD